MRGLGGEEILHSEAERAVGFSMQLVAVTCRDEILFTEPPAPDDPRSGDERMEQGVDAYHPRLTLAP